MADLKTETVKKTLIFCFDGTCYDPEYAEDHAEGWGITNILKLHILFGGNLRDESRSLTNDSLCQRSFYYRGVGTYGGWFRKLINITFAPENGDVKRIVDEAIKDLDDQYPKDSQVDCHVLVFGFSRGAALARRFAAKARGKSGIKDLKIDFLGVFDTVAAISSFSRGLGIGFNPETKPSSSVVYEDPYIKEHVQKVVHLVSLDENRVTSQPTLFNQDGSGRITEVWFPGVHSDIGGGYWYDGLSDSALEYMIKKVEEECGGHVRILDPEEIDYDQLNGEDGTQITKDDIDIKPSVKGTLHKHKRKTITTSTTVGAIAGLVAGTMVGLMVGLIVGAIVDITTDGIAGEIVVFIVGAIADITTGGITEGIAGEIADGIADGIAGEIAGEIAGGIVGLIVGGVITRKLINKITLLPRSIRIAEKPHEGLYPMVHASVQRRYKEVTEYRPYTLRNAKYVVIGNCRQLSGAEQKASELKYVMTADDDQVGDVRQGISELGEE